MKTMLKMWWMFFWRLWVLSLVGFIFTGKGMGGVLVIAFVSAIISIVLYKGFNIEILPSPIKKMIKGYKWYVKYTPYVSTAKRTADVRARPYSAPEDVPPFTIPRPVIDRATALGKMSGYENDKLLQLSIPMLSTVHGSPGAGLNEATTKFGDKSVELGQRGEENFAKALSITNLNGDKESNIPYSKSMLGTYHSFWSMSLPEVDGKKNYNTDVDCVLVYGQKMILIDTKYYKGGDVTYYGDGSYLYTVDNNTSDWVGDPKKMSHNMSMAVERFKKAFPSYDIMSFVLLMPTSMGMGELSIMPYTPIYPGYLYLENIDFALKRIRNFFKDQSDSQYMNSTYFPKLESLLRDGRNV